jgi:hypothetical protein
MERLRQSLDRAGGKPRASKARVAKKATARKRTRVA